MSIRELTCISCPLGCALKVEIDENKNVFSVSGNACKRGEIYAKKEITSPTRTVTSTVRVIGGIYPVVSVRTKTDIPKDKIPECMKKIISAKISAPVRVGDIIIENVCDTGVDIVATRNIKKENKQ
jgi:Uncharacterized protein with conserved CXXC pairs